MADVNIVVAIASKGAEKQLQKLEQDFKDLGSEAQKTGKKTSTALKLAATAAKGAAVAVAAVGAGVVAAVDQASKLQDLETQFIAFTGSAEAAADQVERIAEFSGQTPFQLEELVTANRTLLAFGQTTEESLETLNQLGEVSAGTGADLNELALIFGQVEAAGKLTGERFLQFAERGINLAPILAKQLNVAESEIAELRKQGKISADDVAKAFETMTTNGGKFENSMKRLSLTFSGATSTLKDNISLLAGDLGKLLLPAFTKMTVAATKGIQAIRSFINVSKPEKLRLMNAELDDLKDKLRDAEKGTRVAGSGFLGYTKVNNTSKESVAELKKEISELEKAIVDVSTASDKASVGGGIKPLESTQEEDTGGESSEVSQADKIREDLARINSQKLANRQAAGQAENAAIAEQLDEQLQIIIDKELEKQVALLEAKGQFQEAQLLQAETQANKLAELEKKNLAEAKARGEKARKDEFDFEKKDADARLKFAEQTWALRAQTTQAGLAALASLQYVGSREAFEIAKAASIAQALVSIPSTAIKAYESLAGIPVVGPGLGAAAAAAAVIAGTARVNQIRATKFQAFQDGGLVQGGIPGVDSVPALLTPGEVVVPERNFADLKMSDGEVVNLLTSIKQSMDTLVNLTATEPEAEVASTPISVELTLDGEVLANQILELNQDNQRIA